MAKSISKSSTPTTESAAPKAGNFLALPSAVDHTPQELQRIGEQVVHGRLIAGARERFGYAQAPDDATALAIFNWSAQRIGVNLAAVAAIEKQLGTRDEVEAKARQSAQPMWDSHGGLVAWVKLYKVIVRAPKKIAEAAPRAPRNWAHATKIESVIEPLAKFVEDNAATLGWRGGTAAFAARGRKLAADFAGQRVAHQGDASQKSPETATLRQMEGAVWLELEDLAAAAHAVLPPARHPLYDLRGMFSAAHQGHGQHQPAPLPSAPPGN